MVTRRMRKKLQEEETKMRRLVTQKGNLRLFKHHLNCTWKEEIEQKYRGDIHEIRTRFLKEITTKEQVGHEIAMLHLWRRDLPKHLIKVLEAQLVAKFGDGDRAVELLRDVSVNMKMDQFVQVELMKIVIRETQEPMNDLHSVQEIFKKTPDKKLLELLQHTRTFDRPYANRFELEAAMLGLIFVRPSLIESQLDFAVKCALLRPTRNYIFTLAGILLSPKSKIAKEDAIKVIDVVLVETAKKFTVSTFPDMLDVDRHNVPFRKAAAEMMKCTGPLIFGAACQFGLDLKMKESVRHDGSLDVLKVLKLVENTPKDPITTRLLTFVLMYYRIGLPSYETRSVLTLWQNDFMWGMNIAEHSKTPETQEDEYVYNDTYSEIADSLGRFHYFSKPVKDAVAASGGLETMNYIALALLYYGHYDQLRKILTDMGGDVSVSETPILYAALVIAHYRTEHYADALAMTIFWIDSAIKDDHCELEYKFAHRSMYPEEYLPPKEPELFMVKRENSCQLAIYILNNLVLAVSRTELAEYKNFCYACRIILSQMEFTKNGQATYDKLIEELKKELADTKSSFVYPKLLESVVETYIVSDFSILVNDPMFPCIVCPAQEQRKGLNTRNKGKLHIEYIHKAMVDRLSRIRTQLDVLSSIRDFFVKNIENVLRMALPETQKDRTMESFITYRMYKARAKKALLLKEK